MTWSHTSTGIGPNSSVLVRTSNFPFFFPLQQPTPSAGTLMAKKYINALMLSATHEDEFITLLLMFSFSQSCDSYHVTVGVFVLVYSSYWSHQYTLVFSPTMSSNNFTLASQQTPSAHGQQKYSHGRLIVISPIHTSTPCPVCWFTCVPHSFLIL